MEKKYSVIYKVAKTDAEYVYQQNKGDHKAGDTHASSGGHMWYSLSDGAGNRKSYGFESVYGEMRGLGQVGNYDDAGYKETVYEADKRGQTTFFSEINGDRPRFFLKLRGCKPSI